MSNTEATTNPQAFRDPHGRFLHGNPGGSGNPATKRAAELRLAVLDALGPEHVSAIMRKACKLALEGDVPAMRFVLERTCGRAAEARVEAKPVGIVLPRLSTAADCNAAIERLVDGICKGSVDHDTAKLLIDAIQARLKAIETTELEARLHDLEQAAGTVSHNGMRQLVGRRF